jgi:AcrR family transcriptional regulator
MGENGTRVDSKERLLKEAEILFAQKGFEGVSVREITRAARCNLAAVNYHFGNKENLYLEVFRRRWMPRARRIQESFRQALETDGDRSLNHIIQSLALAFLKGPMSEAEHRYHHQLMAREIAQPTAALEMLAEQVMRPFFRELTDMIRPLAPEGIHEEELMLGAMGIFAMILYFSFGRLAVTRLLGYEYDEALRKRLSGYIADFSIAGLAGFNGDKRHDG